VASSACSGEAVQDPLTARREPSRDLFLPAAISCNGFCPTHPLFQNDLAKV
jgi:hypothetical protein